MNIQNSFSPIEKMVGQISNAKIQNTTTKLDIYNKTGAISFERVFEKTKEDREDTNVGILKFSKHANQRLESRNIDLTKNQLIRLQNGTQKAREKGINESLVMVDNLAFIVNVKNNTVVTAVNDTNDGVFTNIDGAVIS